MTTTVSGGIRLASLSTLITFCITAVSSNAVAQQQRVSVSDSECTTLFNDNTLNEQNVAKRIACHQLSVERIDWLVKQLQSERTILSSQLSEDDPLLLEYKQKLIDNQKTIERLQQRTTDLANLSEALRLQRDEYRKRLLTVINESEARDQSQQLEDRLFRNFSQSYVSLSNENTELRRLLDAQKQNLAGNQSEIGKQQSVIQQLKKSLSTSSDQIEVASRANQQVTEDLQQKQKQLQTIKQKLLDTTRSEQKKKEEILSLNRELALFREKQQQSVKNNQKLNETTALQIDALHNQLQALGAENKTLIETIEKERVQRDTAARDASVVRTNLTAEKTRLEGRLEQSKAQLALFDQQQAELMQQIESSRANLQGLDLTNASLVQKIEKIEEQNDRLHKELDDTEIQLSSSQEQQRSTQEQLLLATAQNKDLNSTLQAREQLADALKHKSASTLDRFKSEALTKHLNIKRLEEQHSRLNAKARQHAADAKEQVATLSAALATSKADLDVKESNQIAANLQYEATIGNLKNRLISRDQRVAELQTLQTKLGDQLETMRSESEANSAEAGKKLSSNEQRITDLKSETARLAADLSAATSMAEDYNDQLTAQTESTAAEIASLKNEADKDKRSIEQLSALANTLEQELATARNKIENDSEALATSENSRLAIEQNTESTLSRFKAQTLVDKQNIARLEEQLMQLDSKYRKAAEKLEQLDILQNTNKTLSADLSNKTLQLNEQISSNEILMSKIAESDSLVSDIEAKLTQTENNSKALDVTLQQKEEQLKTKQLQVDDIESALADAGEENNKLTQQVATLNADLSNLNDLLRQSQNSVESSLEQMREELRASDQRLADRKSALAELINEKQANANALAEHVNASSLLSDSIKSKLTTAGLSDAIVELQADQTIAIRVGSNTLFRPGSSQLTEEGTGVLAIVGNSIAEVEKRKIVVEGHSDNTPLGARLERVFVDNWGLSMARAVSTANFLSRNTGIAANLLSVSGLGDTDPVADNATVAGRQRNRRVEILLVDDNSP